VIAEVHRLPPGGNACSHKLKKAVDKDVDFVEK
jgi:hypothetical protein